MFTKALMLDPDKENTYYYLGLAYHKTNNQTRALEALNRTVKLNPENGFAQYLLGSIYEDILEVEKAISSYTLARKFAPEILDVHYKLGMLLYRTNYLQSAMEPLREFIILQPDSINVLKVLGLMV